MELSVKTVTLATGLLLSTSIAAVDINLIESDTPDPAQVLVDALLSANSNISVVPGSAQFIGRVGEGDLAQSATYQNFSLSPSDGVGPTIQIADGILLTTGVANLPDTNTVENWSQGGVDVSQPGTGGNALLSELAGTPTFDQNVLEFQFTFDNPGDNAIRFEFVFGSDEFPTQVVTDIFGAFVDGVNFALFENGDLVGNNPSTPFVSNPLGSDRYAIEYNGLTQTLTITALVDPDLETHTAVFAIADTFDSIFDSGVFLGNLRAAFSDDGGIGPICPIESVVGTWDTQGEFCGNFNSTATSVTYESARVLEAIEPPVPTVADIAEFGYTYEVDFIINRPNQPTAASGILVNGNSSSTFGNAQIWDQAIAFAISADGRYSIFQFDSGSVQALQPWTNTAAGIINEPGEVNTLSVVSTGTQLLFSINGEVVRTLNNPTSTGEFGMGFVRSIPTGQPVDDDWMSIEAVRLEDGFPVGWDGARNLDQLVSPAQHRLNLEAQQLGSRDEPWFATRPAARAPVGR